MSGFLARLFSSGEPVLSEASVRDAPDIAALHAQSFQRGWSEDECERLLGDPAVLTHRAVIGGKLVGFIMARIAADEAEILSVAVSRACRGRRIAGQMLSLSMRRLAGLGVRRIFLEVGETNDPAARLYARAGFTEVSRRPNYYPGGDGKPIAALVLRRDLV
jgi:ribosomal-protein-alanine N-acetyltransferase